MLKEFIAKNHIIVIRHVIVVFIKYNLSPLSLEFCVTFPATCVLGMLGMLASTTRSVLACMMICVTAASALITVYILSVNALIES